MEKQMKKILNITKELVKITFNGFIVSMVIGSVICSFFI